MVSIHKLGKYKYINAFSITIVRKGDISKRLTQGI